jgi:hypothetical protein
MDAMTERDIANVVLAFRGVRGLVIKSPPAEVGVVWVQILFSYWTWFFPGWRWLIRRRAQRKLYSLRPWGTSIRVVG